MITVAFATLGCKVNQAETEALAERFAAAGYRLTNFAAPADVYILNTCTVTHIADRKGRQLLRQARRRNPQALVVAMGCYATTDPVALQRATGVDLIVPNQQKERLLELVESAILARQQRIRSATGDEGVLSVETATPGEAVPQDLEGEPLAAGLRPLVNARTRAFVKVQDGCDNFCAYCIVPFARGRPRSIPLPEVVSRVQALALAGYKEVVLTGVHLGLYGSDLVATGQAAAKDRSADFSQERAMGLISLVQAILRETTIPRLRLSSIEPQDFDPAFLDLWRDRRLCRHLHLPLQSGSAATLRRMGRRYTPADFAELVARIRSAIPEIAITTDMIVGFPGESEAEFRESYDFARAMGFARIHVFKFSPRRGTRAAAMPEQVPEQAKQERSHALLALSAESGRAFRAQFIGKVMEVLWEEPVKVNREKGTKVWDGLTDNYIRVEAEGKEDLANCLRPVRLVALTPQGMAGVLL